MVPVKTKSENTFNFLLGAVIGLCCSVIICLIFIIIFIIVKKNNNTDNTGSDIY